MPDPDGSAAPTVPSPARRERRRRAKRRMGAFLAVTLLLLAGGVALVGMALRERKPSLLAQATKIMDMQNCQEYAWKSEHEIARYNYYRAGVGYSVYDTNTHITTPIVILKKHSPNFQGGMHTGPRLFFYPKPGLVRIAIWDDTPKDWAKRKFQTQVPPDHVVYLRKTNGITQQDVNRGGSSSVVSPRNDLVAWWFPRTQQAPRWAALLHRFVPSIKIGPQSVMNVYVSHTDGSNMRLLGSIPPIPDNAQALMQRRKFYLGFSHAAWTPDGKQLCFPYGDSLYTVAVE